MFRQAFITDKDIYLKYLLKSYKIQKINKLWDYIQFDQDAQQFYINIVVSNEIKPKSDDKLRESDDLGDGKLTALFEVLSCFYWKKDYLIQFSW